MRTLIIATTAVVACFAALSSHAAPVNGPFTARTESTVAPTPNFELTLLSLAETPYTREGEPITLGLATAAASAATFSAPQLPDGLAIDPATGVISGFFGPQAAGQHRVVIEARTDRLVERLSFTWVVLEATLPMIDSPGIVLNRAGDEVELSLVAADADGEALTFAAYGLPRGLVIDTATGVISGTLEPHALRTTYSLSVTASDGHVTGGTVFTWIVLPTRAVD